MTAWRTAIGVISVTGILALPAAAADQSTQAKLEKLESELQALQTQIQDLKAAQGNKFNESQRQIAALPKVALSNGRPTFTSADGAFSASLRALVQVDGAYYSQDLNPATPVANSDLSSGSNFRRSRIGLEGKVFTDWDYSFIYDFGGSGVEAATISNAYIQYNFAPFAVRAGAFPPYATLEDSAGAAETLFLERASAVEIARSLAGGDGRTAISFTATGDRYLASIAYTGQRVGQSGFFDEQQALLGRLAGQVVKSPNSNVVLGVNGTYVFDPADATAGGGAASTGINFQNQPELRVDALNLVSTGNLNSNTAGHWGVDGGANWKNYYIEGGYFGFFADRQGALSDVDFDGWYAQASWILTGEARRYDPARATFRGPSVAKPVGGSDGGWGAWEIAARYSTVNLNSDENASVIANRVRGGEQDIWTGGLNWYANNAIKVSLDYQKISVDRAVSNTNPAQAGQDADAISLRIQFSI